MNELPNNIKRVALLTVWGFLLTALVFGYWQVVRAPALRTHPYNQQAQQRIKSIKPGSIYTRDGELILGVKKATEGWQRTYPAGPAYCHLTGYNEKTGLQKGLREALFGIGPYQNRWGFTQQGLDIVLTIDSKAQQRAAGLMEGKQGAVIALEPNSGAILVMVVAAAALDSGTATPQTIFHCSGTERIAGVTVKCRRLSGHGKLTLSRALADSCNITFAKLSQLIGPERFRSYVKKFSLLAMPELPLPAAHGKMADLVGDDGEAELVQAAIGQGAILVTPIALAQLVATIANGGQIIQPYLVDRITRQDGETVTAYRGYPLGRTISQETARQVAGMMQLSVEEGRASNVALPGCRVAAVTGPAQSPEGRSHSWAVGFAPVEAPQAVVVVIVENTVADHPVAGPIARQIIEALVSCR